MPFKFSHVCRLLSDLEAIAARNPPLLPRDRDEELKRKIRYWFRCYRREIDAKEVDGVTLLSTLLPEKRVDRVYGLQESRLCKVIARCLHLNKSNIKILQSWNQPGKNDLGMCVERVLKEFDCERKPGAFVTLEEIDLVLHNLASQCRFSGPTVRSFAAHPSPTDDQLAHIFKRLDSVGAKWFTRLILKDFSFARVDYELVILEYHFLLPGLLRFQDSFQGACAVLKTELKHFPSQPDSNIQRIGRAEAAKVLTPMTGTKVGRQTYVKARSMQHCVNLCGMQAWSAERKYDGEYCEVHVDVSRGNGAIQIFSKSGKDSTEDRKGIHKVLRECLRLGEKGCAFKRKCIVTGELVVWSDQERRLLDFYHLRKHIARSGVFLGRDQDSQIRPGEHLMIIFYDILLVDDDILLREPYTKRRARLKEVLRYKPGFAMPAERTIIDFGKPETARKDLCKHFAAALASRCEGLVLKPIDAAYFRFTGDQRAMESGFVIKLKKDYLQEIGEARDVLDFAVVGASFDPKIVHKSSIRNPQFTTFHLGCCVNRDAAERFGELPKFEIVAAISLDQCIPQSELQALHNYTMFRCSEARFKGNRLEGPQIFDLIFTHGNASRLQFILNEPCVVEVLGSGYERPSNKDYFMLRHPRVLKVHADRTWREACTFGELASYAEEARNAPDEGETQEMSQLFKMLQGKLRRKAERGQTQNTCTTRMSTTTTAQSARSARSTTQTPTPNKLPRRSPRRVQHTPVLVRVDTVERLRGEETAAAYEGRPQLLDQTTLPTPPTSSAESNPSALASVKRKALTPVRSSPRKRLNTVVEKHSVDANSTILAPRSHNAQGRQSTRAESADYRASKSRLKASSVCSPSRTPLQQADNRNLICPNPACPFSRSVVFLSPCVRSFSWVSESLLSWHNAEQISALKEWARDNAVLDPSHPTIVESMSFPDRQKLVLVETNRLEATMACVDAVKSWKVRDLVIFFDWRVLEDWREIESKDSRMEKISQAQQSVLENRFFGITCWSSEEGEVIFMHQNLAKMPRRWLDDA